MEHDQKHSYLSSGCVHGWMMPFMSRYRLSNSTSLGFGLVVSTGIRTPLHSFPCEDRYQVCEAIHISAHTCHYFRLSKLPTLLV